MTNFWKKWTDYWAITRDRLICFKILCAHIFVWKLAYNYRQIIFEYIKKPLKITLVLTCGFGGIKSSGLGFLFIETGDEVDFAGDFKDVTGFGELLDGFCNNVGKLVLLTWAGVIVTEFDMFWKGSKDSSSILCDDFCCKTSFGIRSSSGKSSSTSSFGCII